MTPPVIVWFRRNLRLSDNLALLAAADSGQPVIALYVHDELDSGGASRWWLHHSLAALGKELAARDNRLVIRTGKPEAAIADLAGETGADALYLARRYEPPAKDQETALRDALADEIDIHAYDDYMLRPPGEPLTQSGDAYKVFTPFWKASVALGTPDEPRPAPEDLPALSKSVSSVALDELGLLPTRPDWAQGLRDAWVPGEQGALAQLDTAVEKAGGYAKYRDRPDLDQTSRLSPHLHFGELSPRQVWHAIRTGAAGAASSKGAEALLRQLYWRDFSWYLLHHFPRLPDEPLRPEYAHFPWTDDRDRLKAWQRGRTGYPLVDAGMRQLWESGWMHNRVRMVVASFLVKNLMIAWQDGADWFLDTLVDADLANNSAGWQWVAGCGTDSAPYFRIFNPVLQSAKFDPEGDYIRRWVPELSGLSAKHIHEPWKADEETLKEANIDLGKDYPLPIVDLGESRQRALDAYQDVRSLQQSPAASPGSSAG